MPMTRAFGAYAWLKLRAMASLVVGRGRAAEAVFDELLRRWPDDAYALASRSHLRAQDG
ncbi:MAG: pilus assembly protein PilF, partial [Hyphomicrobium sp.]|nr:pilus assembly protein PilF [Hyphomicrobium sp.]